MKSCQLIYNELNKSFILQIKIDHHQKTIRNIFKLAELAEMKEYSLLKFAFVFEIKSMKLYQSLQYPSSLISLQISIPGIGCW